jgi:hypothetical protein
MFERLKSIFTRTPMQAALLPPVVDPKVPNKSQAKQSFSKRTATASGDQRLISDDRRTANLDLLSLRNGTTTKSTIRDLSAVSPDLSASVFAYTRLAVTRNFNAVARNLDGTISPEATKLTQAILARLNFLNDYSQGFSATTGIHAVAEQLMLELRLYGSCSLELVLDKARIPNRLQPISVTQIEFLEDASGYAYPIQRVNKQEINLDTPGFFYESLDQDLLTAYSNSPMESALQATLADAEFTNDIRRSIKKALHPRLDAEIDSDKFRKSIPISIAGDKDEVDTYQNNFIGAVESTVNGLEPDDALVHFDSVKFAYVNNGNATLSDEWKTLQGLIDSKTATGTKSPSFVLGHGSGSQNVASSESMLFIKYVEGVQLKLNSILSRALTLATRLLGQDVYVEFAFDRIDLRPHLETTSFRVMEQSRVLELLSIGMMSDEEASILLTGNLPPAGYKPLSGTFFKAGATDPNAVDTSSALSNTGAVQQSVTPDTPQAPKGPAKNAPKNAEIDLLTEKHAVLEQRLGEQAKDLDRQRYEAIVAQRKEPARQDSQPLSVHVHMPEGMVQMSAPVIHNAAAPAPNVQVDVHVPEAAAPTINVAAPTVNVAAAEQQAPVVNAAAPQVTVTNEVNPAPVTVNNAFSRGGARSSTCVHPADAGVRRSPGEGLDTDTPQEAPAQQA